MSKMIAFDVYGTLIDTHGVVEKLQSLIGDQAKNFSQTWREKQLEYSFRRGLMKDYENFAVCTTHALDYCCAFYKADINQVQKNELLEVYTVLPAFADVENCLIQLKNAGYAIYAFSNGSKQAVEKLLQNASIKDYFIDVISVNDLRSFKPDPAVYRHLLSQTKSFKENAWLISSNSFDVIGALNVGMKAAWVQRSNDVVFDTWGIQPTGIINSLSELDELLK